MNDGNNEWVTDSLLSQEEREARGEREEQLSRPSMQLGSDILQTHFALSKKPVQKPSFNHKRELQRLRELSMRKVSSVDFEPGWRRLVELLDGVFEDITDIKSDATSLAHPTYWRALGFSGPDPYSDFSKYFEPEDGAGKVCAEDDWERGFKLKNNAYQDTPLSPLTSRYRGGLLTQQCMLFFVETCPIARSLLTRRRRGSIAADEENYNYAFVAMEITRFLALEFMLILTRVQESPNFPLQPDMQVSMPFDVDWQDKSALIVYPMRNIWVTLSERDAFKRLHVLSTIVYEYIYTVRSAQIGQTYAVLEETRKFIRDSLANSSSLREMEATIDEAITSKYLDAQRTELARAAAQSTMESVISRAMQADVRALVKNAVDEAEHSEARRIGRKERRAAEGEAKEMEVEDEMSQMLRK